MIFTAYALPLAHLCTRTRRMYGEFVARADTVFRACVCDSMSGMSTRYMRPHRSKIFELAESFWR